MQMRQIKAFDELFLAHGIEENAIEDAAQRYEWEDDPMFMAAMDTMEKKMKKANKKKWAFNIYL